MDFAGGQSVQMPSESDMMHQVKAELATAYAQEFYNVSTENASCPAGSCSRTELNSSPIFFCLFVWRHQTVRDKCFKACVTSPSSSLSSSERTCLERCVDRYVEATQVVSQSAIKALQGHS